MTNIHDNIDYGRSLENLMRLNFIRYRGFQIEKTKGGFLWNGGFFSCEKILHETIDRHIEDWHNAIVEQNSDLNK